MTTLAFIGDVMLGRGVNAALRHVEAESVWGSTLPLLRSADAVIANLECAITLRQTHNPLAPKRFHFRADPVAVDVLLAGNVRCVSLANNHSVDFGEDGLFDTMEALASAGIAHAGAGRTAGMAAAPAIVHLPDLTIGVVALTDAEPPFAATRRAAGTHYVDIEGVPHPAFDLAELASRCRDRKVDLAILSAHWGPAMATAPSARFRDFAHAAIDAGFDVVHGHSSHTFHGVEMVRDRPIFYDTGGFIDDYRVDERLRNDLSFLFLVDVTHARVQRVRMIPVRLDFARTNLANGEEARATCRRMLERSAPFGTRIAAGDGTLTITQGEEAISEEAEAVLAGT